MQDPEDPFTASLQAKLQRGLALHQQGRLIEAKYGVTFAGGIVQAVLNRMSPKGRLATRSRTSRNIR